MTQIVNSISEWQNLRPKISGSIGFVPTMGALHEGHLSLVRSSLKENSKTVVSLFVNPTQFDNPDDLENYPGNFQRDSDLLKGLGVDFIFWGQTNELYPDDYRYRITENQVSQTLCGAHRPGHFDGVLTIVMKLLQIVQPSRAYFGEKDFQQLKLIKGMVEAFFLPVTIVSGPIVREEDGLALSSRNQRLSEAQRQRAPEFYEILKKATDTKTAIQNLKDKGFDVDYVEEWQGRRLGAVYLGNVRLIDNVPIK